MPQLPARLHGFTALEELTLAANGLKGRCLSSLQALPRLRKVDLQDNVITDIPPWTDAAPLPELAELLLTNNHISLASALLPLEELPSLRRVVLAGNPLSRKAELAAKRVGTPILLDAAPSTAACPFKPHAQQRQLSYPPPPPPPSNLLSPTAPQAARAKEAEYRAAGLPQLRTDAEQMMESAAPPASSAAPLALPAPPSGSALAAPPAPPAKPPTQIRCALPPPVIAIA